MILRSLTSVSAFTYCATMIYILEELLTQYDNAVILSRNLFFRRLHTRQQIVELAAARWPIGAGAPGRAPFLGSSESGKVLGLSVVHLPRHFHSSTVGKKHGVHLDVPLVWASLVSRPHAHTAAAKCQQFRPN